MVEPLRTATDISPATLERSIAAVRPEALYAERIDLLQVNLGRRCNSSCTHCHQSCSPSCTEAMDEPTLDAVSRIAREVRPALVDITGGSPELHPGLPALVSRLRSADLRTQVRTNLTALLEPEAEGVIDHLAGAGVQLLASLPALTAEGYACQRGDRLQTALSVLERLNDAGWARSDNLRLDLSVDSSGYGADCSECELTARYRAALTDDLGIHFNDLVLITTMPIGRFRAALERRGEYEAYLSGLAERFNPATVAGLSCRTAIEIAWDGTLSDCDFNLAAGLRTAEGEPAHISEFDTERLARRRIRFAPHCWACTAGAGSG
ncbi:DUF3641 domain-containing protein [Anaerosoma tenue]|uniref:DUF3641 domain-containing protein n=1 Tax=Anaerosoma tenue TaxID=2933588 RepID=UPI00226087F8|nr:DUF3641 domain-containing protein [Anaerosoma tenue]MCK8115099.1 DUF3641 domain-containing protein [Anaerosoma tenue]